MDDGVESARIDGVEVLLDQAWATRSVRKALLTSSYEKKERVVLAATLMPDDTYLELGCGIGVLAAIAAARVGDDSIVVVDADPYLVSVARETTARNGHTIDVRNAVLLHDPVDSMAAFYVRPDFRLSSLTALPKIGMADKPPARSRKIQVPVIDAYKTIADVGATYLMVDIEGGETDLLRFPLPNCVATVCVELHSKATGIRAQSQMLAALLANGYDLDVPNSDLPVLLFRRRLT